MGRKDISDKLIHFTSPRDNPAEAFSHLKAILTGNQIQAGYENRKGGYLTVCFTEAPFSFLRDGLVNSKNHSRYAPFGVIFDKKWIFEKGGRPVIYQPESEFDLLPEELRWRHVRYELFGDEVIDWTWEREWRIYCEALSFSPNEAGIVVPDAYWANVLCEEHDLEQDCNVLQYAQIFDQEIAEMYRENFPWRIYLLND